MTIRVCASIEAWMDQGWSPKLIADVLARDLRGDKLRRVSHETIYQGLYVQARGGLRADLHKCLSTKPRPANSPDPTGRTGGISPGVIQHQRPPAEADDRAVPGHWESQWCCQAA